MRVSADELTLRQVYIHDNSPEKPVDLTWPSVTGLPSFLSGKIKTLTVKSLIYRKLDQSPFTVSGISSRADWNSGVLSLKDFSLSMPSVSVKGNASVGFVRPSLKADLIVDLTKPIEKMNGLSLKAYLATAKSPVQAEGSVSVIAVSGEKEKAYLSGELGIERKALVLKKLRLSRTGKAGEVKGDGRIFFTAAGSEFESRLEIEGLDLSHEISVKTDISGGIHLKGTMESYRGELSLTNKSEKWRSANISGYFKGNREGLRIEIEKGLLLNGNLSGILEANWSKGIELSGKLRGRNLNPDVISPDWTGVVNLDVDVNADLSREETEGSVKARLLESRLHGRTLAGKMNAGFRGRNISIADFFLKGRGFDLHAKGELQEKLSFAADITNLSFLFPGAKGALRAEGWTRMEEGRFSGSVSGKARGVVYQGARMKGIDLTASLSGLKEQPVSLKADISGFSYNNIDFDRLASRIDGTMMSHKIAIDAAKKKSFEFHAGLKGSYKDKRWEGNILSLRGRDAVGPFGLEAPVKVLLSKAEISFSLFALKGAGPERVTAAGEIGPTQKGFVKASFERFNPARLNQWLKDKNVSGTVSGNVSAELQKKTLTKATATLSAAGVFSSAGQSVRIEKGALKFLWDNRGLDGSLQVILAKGGFLHGKITSPLPPVIGLPASGNLNAEWKEMNLVLLRPWLPDETMISGSSTGTLSAGWKDNDIASLSADSTASGAFSSAGQRFGVKNSFLKINWNSRGLRASFDMEPEEGGEIHGTFFSQGKPHPDLPDRGEISADLKDFDPSIFRRWLPEDIVFKGRISGHAEGKILPGRLLNFSGNIAIIKGFLTYHTAKGLVSAEMKTAKILWTWQGETLQGEVSLVLAEYGSLKGQFSLPIPARIPLSANPAGPLKADLSAKMKENGLLTSLFPGMVRESYGDLDLSLKVKGTWSAPDLTGTLQLEHAGGFFPSAGIEIENVLVRGHFDKNKIAVDHFQAESGQGKINGNASFLIEKWHIKSYSGTLKGGNFRAVHLPELRAEINPQITFEGDAKKLFVRGDITVPNLLIAESKAGPYIEPSKDVIIVNGKKEKAHKTPLQLDIEVHIMFVDGLFVRSEGIDAQLNGDIILTVQDINNIRGKGNLKVVKGTYKNYGVELKIERGLVLFAGGKIGNPSLDMLTLRSINEIRAGVVVSGTLENPIIKLYSEPSMPEPDILAYIVLGHPLGGGSGEQASLLMKVAGTLLSRGESTVLQNQLKKNLGLDVLDIESGGTAEGATAARSMLTVGKYLTSKLFISYGQSLFDRGGLFKMRYSLSKHFEVESQSGVESGVDFIYKIDLK